MRRDHYYRIFAGITVLGLSSFVMEFMRWVFAESHGTRLLIPAFCLIIAVSYPVGLFIDFLQELKGRNRDND